MIDDKDKQLFRETIEAFTPEDKDRIYKNTTLKQPPFTKYSCVIDATITGEEVVSYRKNGVSGKLINKMKRGHIEHISTLDLHGYTIEAACEALSDFMYHHQFEQFIQIIHGKGYHSENGASVLKTQVVNFLKQHPQVLACHSCPPKDGGTGAIFALLKQNAR
ncbi:Smr domain protein [uncultured Candidatus Thioglobus sp.]|nr:Smr domain protein [uncultured Candidatus Thioglobus sp.]